MKNKKLVLFFALVAVLVASVMICSFIAFAEDNDVTVAKLGDVDGNGTVGAEDVVAFSQYFANYDYDNPTTDERMIAVADLSGDGKVTLVDLQMLRVGLANGYFDEPEGCAHEWADATCETPKTCSICGETEGEALGHDMVTDAAVDPSCTATGLTEGAHCSRCDGATTAQTVVDALGHAWGEEDANGSKICNLCGEVETKDAAEVYFFLNAINWDNEYLAGKSFNQPLVFSKDYEGYPNDLGYVPTDSSHPGLLYIQGWGGSNYEAEGIVYRVVDANGEALTEWTPLAQHSTYPTLSAATDGVLTNVQNKIPDGYAYYFRGYADVTAFSEEYVTVEVAFVLKGSSKNDEHFEFLTVKDVLYNRPVQFQVQYAGAENKAQLVDGKPTSFNDALTTPSTGDNAGKIFFQGYGGTIGEVSNVQFRVRSNSTGEIIQGWKGLDQYKTYPKIAEYDAQLSFVQSAIPGATKCYMVRGYMDISAFYGQTVTIEIAFVLEDQTHFIFATETNCTNTAERPVGLNINSLQGYLKPSWHTEVLVFGEDYTYSGSTSNVTKPSYPTGGIATSGTEKGTLYLAGWAGTNAEATDLVFRVLDANGNVISTASEGYTDGWTNDIVKEKASSGGYYNTFGYDATATKSLQQTVDGGFAYSFRGYLNLREFAGQSVTVECALVLKDVPESQKYFTIITVEKVNVGS